MSRSEGQNSKNDGVRLPLDPSKSNGRHKSRFDLRRDNQKQADGTLRSCPQEFAIQFVWQWPDRRNCLPSSLARVHVARVHVAKVRGKRFVTAVASVFCGAVMAFLPFYFGAGDPNWLIPFAGLILGGLYGVARGFWQLLVMMVWSLTTEAPLLQISRYGVNVVRRRWFGRKVTGLTFLGPTRVVVRPLPESWWCRQCQRVLRTSSPKQWFLVNDYQEVLLGYDSDDSFGHRLKLESLIQDLRGGDFLAAQCRLDRWGMGYRFVPRVNLPVEIRETTGGNEVHISFVTLREDIVLRLMLTTVSCWCLMLMGWSTYWIYGNPESVLVVVMTMAFAIVLACWLAPLTLARWMREQNFLVATEKGRLAIGQNRVRWRAMDGKGGFDAGLPICSGTIAKSMFFVWGGGRCEKVPLAPDSGWVARWIQDRWLKGSTNKMEPAWIDDLAADGIFVELTSEGWKIRIPGNGWLFAVWVFVCALVGTLLTVAIFWFGWLALLTPLSLLGWLSLLLHAGRSFHALQTFEIHSRNKEWEVVTDVSGLAHRTCIPKHLGCSWDLAFGGWLEPGGLRLCQDGVTKFRWSHWQASLATNGRLLQAITFLEGNRSASTEPVCE